MTRWWPSVDEERWLEVASELRGAVDCGALAERTGGWRSTGLLARIALFVLGCVAAGLAFGIVMLGTDGKVALFIAGSLAVLVGEWLRIARRLHGSGIEEGLCVAGSLMFGLWIITLVQPDPGFAGGSAEVLFLIAMVAAAGLRLLNPVVVTLSVLALVYWVASTTMAHALDQAIGTGVAAFAFGCAIASLALVLGAREYRRPSFDRMLDWLVATLPVVAWSQRADVYAFEAAAGLADASMGPVFTVLLLLALGAAMLAAGLRRRRHAPLIGFLACLACVAVEVRLATQWPTEIWLITCGLAALGAGFVIDRYLRQPRNGLTSASLQHREGPLDLLQLAGASLLAQRPAVGQPHPEPEAELEAGEGRFGGGGASGRF